MNTQRRELHVELAKLGQTTATLGRATESLTAKVEKIARSTKAWLRSMPCVPPQQADAGRDRK